MNHDHQLVKYINRIHSITNNISNLYFLQQKGIASGRSFIAGEAPLQDSIDSVLQIISIHRCTVVVLFATHEELSDVSSDFIMVSSCVIKKSTFLLSHFR